jgi:hypothetical protein
MPPATERQRTTTWAEFIRTHLAVMASTDFFTVEVLTLRGLVTYYMLFAGLTVHPNEQLSNTFKIERRLRSHGQLFFAYKTDRDQDRDDRYPQG